jgi:sugar O-acyltransferase (sialic acid O-acetyltransferase NeuD family)
MMDMEVHGMGEPILFWGATGQAIVLHEFLCTREHRLIALVDRDPGLVPPFPGVPLFRDLDGLVAFLGSTPLSPGFVVAVAGALGAERIALSEVLRAQGLRPVRAIHPSAWIARDAEVGMGLQAMAGSRIGARASLADWVIVNTGASIDHECRIGSGAHLAPGVILCGCVEVGECAMVGAGAIVLPRVRIGANAIVGAGSVVVRDIPEGVVAFGNPARVVRTLGA